MDGDRRVERVADYVDEVMIGEAPGFGKAGRVHEDKQAELLDAGEYLTKPLGREVFARNICRNLDAAKPQRFVDAVELGDRQVGRLKRHRAERGEAVGVAADDVRQIVVDDAGRSDP